MPTGNDSDRLIAERQPSSEGWEGVTSLFHTMPFGVVIHDADGTILASNPAAEAILGLTADQMRGRTPIDSRWKAMHEDGSPFPGEGHPAMETLRTGQPILNKVMGVFHPVGKTRWIHVSTTLLYRPDETRPHQAMAIFVDITDRIEAEQARQQSDGTFRALFNGMLNGAAYCKMLFENGKPSDFIYLAVNEAFQRQTGLRDVVGKKVSEVLPGIRDSDPALIETYGRVATSGRPETFEIRLKALDAWFTISAFSPEPGHFAAIFDVTTERKKSKALLQESEERFSRAFQFLPAAAGITTLQEGRFIAVNREYSEVFGYQEDELLGHASSEFNIWADPRDRGKVVSMLERGEAVHSVEVQIRRKDGSLGWVSYSGERVVINGMDCLLSGAVDITTRKQAEIRSQESEAQLRLFVEFAPAAIAMLDTDLKYLVVSRRWLEDYNLSRDSIIGCSHYEIFPEIPQRWVDIHKRCLAGAVESCAADPFPRADGKTDWVRWEIRPWSRPDGSIGGIIIFSEVITSQKEAEAGRLKLQAQLQQSQKMESLGILAGGVAHDMNNVLGAILGLASANVQIQAPGSTTYESFETIAKAAARGGEMVRGLLAFARHGQAEERTLNLNALLQEEANLLERTTLAKVKLSLDLAPDLHPIKGDAGTLAHAFMNLCVNAVDALPDNGTLSIRTRNVGWEWVEVIVEDTGIGMSTEVLEKAMDPFFTTKGVGKGTGLGLSLVYSTVKAHRGQIEIQSKPGQGTVVQMRFPASEPVMTDHRVGPGPRTEGPKRTLKILLIDDDELIQNASGMVIQTLGHSVTPSSSGEEALALIKAGFMPDMVILDMNMPGLGGKRTLPLLREMLPNVPVLLSTGRTDQAALDLSKAHPFVTVLPKPFAIQELQMCLESLIGD